MTFGLRFLLQLGISASENEHVSVGGAAHPGTNPGTLGRKFSRWTSRHGTAFANRASDVSFPRVGVLRVTL